MKELTWVNYVRDVRAIEFSPVDGVSVHSDVTPKQVASRCVNSQADYAGANLKIKFYSACAISYILIYAIFWCKKVSMRFVWKLHTDL